MTNSRAADKRLRKPGAIHLLPSLPGCDKVGTEENEEGSYRLVPREEVLADGNGDEGGNDGLEVRVDTDGSSPEVLHGKGDHEIAQHGSENNDEEHAERTAQPVGRQGSLRDEGRALDVADSEGYNGNAGNEENPLHLGHG